MTASLDWRRQHRSSIHALGGLLLHACGACCAAPGSHSGGHDAPRSCERTIFPGGTAARFRRTPTGLLLLFALRLSAASFSSLRTLKSGNWTRSIPSPWHDSPRVVEVTREVRRGVRRVDLRADSSRSFGGPQDKPRGDGVHGTSRGVILNATSSPMLLAWPSTGSNSGMLIVSRPSATVLCIGGRYSPCHVR